MYNAVFTFSTFQMGVTHIFTNGFKKLFKNSFNCKGPRKKNIFNIYNKSPNQSHSDISLKKLRKLFLAIR